MQNRCIQDGAPRCQAIPGGVVDDAVGTLLLDTLTPHALEVALTVQAELDTRAAEADALRRQAVERARHRADLARRRYLAVDPDNRLVADSLEADWNDALRALQAAREDYERVTAAAAAALTDQVKHQIRSLATDFPALWANPHTPQRDRKRMVRLLVDDVTLHKTDRIHLHVRLRGGQTRSLAIAIPPTSWQARQTRPDTVAALDRLLDTHTDAEAAEALNAAGHRSGENKPFTAGIVVHVRHKYHLPSHADRLRAQGLLTTTELAQRLEVHPSTVKSWTKAGILNSHKANDKNERLYQPPIPGRPPPHHPTRQPTEKTSSHPTHHRRCTMKPSPCRSASPTEPTDGSTPSVDECLGERHRGVLTRFNRWTQHLTDGGAFDGTTTRLGGGIDGAGGDAVAGSASGTSGSRTGVLGADRGWAHQRGRGGGVRRVGSGGIAVVPTRWRNAADRAGPGVGEISVLLRTRGHRGHASAGNQHASDRDPDQKVTVDDISGTPSQRRHPQRQARVPGIDCAMEGRPRRATT